MDKADQTTKYSDELREYIAHVSEYNLDFQGITFENLSQKSMAGDCLLHALVHAWTDWGENKKLLQELIDIGVEIDASGDLGFTPLHVACLRGYLDPVSILVRNGAGLDIDSETGGKPIDVASLHKHDEIVEFLSQAMTEKS